MCRFKVRGDIVCVDLSLGAYSVCRFKVKGGYSVCRFKVRGI